MKKMALGLLALFFMSSCQMEENVLQDNILPEVESKKYFKEISFDTPEEVLRYVEQSDMYSQEDRDAIRVGLQSKTKTQTVSNLKIPTTITPPDKDDFPFPPQENCQSCSLKVSTLSYRKFLVNFKTPDNVWLSGSPVAVGYDVRTTSEEFSLNDGFSSTTLTSTCGNSYRLYEPAVFVCANHDVIFYVHNTNAGFVGFWNLNNWINFPNINHRDICAASNAYTFIGPSHPVYCPYD